MFLIIVLDFLWPEKTATDDPMGRQQYPSQRDWASEDESLRAANMPAKESALAGLRKPLSNDKVRGWAGDKTCSQ